MKLVRAKNNAHLAHQLLVIVTEVLQFFIVLSTYFRGFHFEKVFHFSVDGEFVDVAICVELVSLLFGLRDKKTE